MKLTQMKRKLPPLTRRELWLLFAPFPVLWLGLGIFVNPTVFRFWVAGQNIRPLDAMLLMFVPISFAAIYGFLILVARAIERPINLTSVAICAFIAAFIGFIFCPIP